MLTWKAIYHDGEGNLTPEVFAQYNPDKTENAYKDIDRFKLGRFDLVDESGKTVHSTYIHGNQRLVFRRRNFITVGGQLKGTMYIVGWVQTVTTPNGNKDIYAFNYVHEDGSVALDNHRENIELLPEEY